MEVGGSLPNTQQGAVGAGRRLFSAASPGRDRSSAEAEDRGWSVVTSVAFSGPGEPFGPFPLIPGKQIVDQSIYFSPYLSHLDEVHV